MKKIFFLIIGLIFTFAINAQSISRMVIGNAGTHFENDAFGEIHFTVGEMAIQLLQPLDGGSLGEGFHRANYNLVVSTEYILPEDWSVRVFPNPTIGKVVLETDNHQLKIAVVYNQLGQRLMERQISEPKTDFDFAELPSGAYFLRIVDVEGQSRTFKIMKF